MSRPNLQNFRNPMYTLTTFLEYALLKGLDSDKEGKMKQVIGYVRVSRDRTADDKISPTIQSDAIIRHCKNNSLKLVEIIQDLDIKGSSFKRPGWQKLVEKLPTVHGVVFYSLDRFGRNLEESLKWGRYLQEQGKELISVNEQLDMETLGGKIHYKTLLFMSDIFLEMHTQRMKDVQQHKRDKGEWGGGTPPFGYRVIAGCQPTICAQEADMVRDIFAMRKKSSSCIKIIEMLNKKYGRSMSKSTLSYIVKNHNYTGYGLDKEGKEYKNGLPPIISRQDFKEAQAHNTSNRHLVDKPLRGRILCNKCGSVMYFHKKPDGRHNWACSSMLRGEGCSGVTVRDGKVQMMVKKEFDRLSPGLWSKWDNNERAKALDLMVEHIVITPSDSTRRRIHVIWRDKEALDKDE